jgi:hypothetical protein
MIATCSYLVKILSAPFSRGLACMAVINAKEALSLNVAKIGHTSVGILHGPSISLVSILRNTNPKASGSHCLPGRRFCRSLIIRHDWKANKPVVC